MPGNNKSLWLWGGLSTAFISDDLGQHWREWNAGLPGTSGSDRTVLGFPDFGGSQLLICSDGIYKFNTIDSTWSTFNRGLSSSVVGDFVVSDSLLIIESQSGLYSLSKGVSTWNPLPGDNGELLKNSWITDIYFSHDTLLATNDKLGVIQLDMVDHSTHIKKSSQNSQADNINFSKNYLVIPAKWESYLIKLYDLKGVNLISKRVGAGVCGRLDISKYHAGSYVLEISDGNRVVHRTVAICK
jgi:hypothetical protein